MASGEKLLTALQVQRLKEPGRYADGAGLYLSIDAKGRKTWLLRVQANGRRRDFGLGSVKKGVTLAAAREMANRYREEIALGGDPSASRKARSAKTVGTPTFAECAEKFHAEYRPIWRNEKHAAQVLTTLKTYAVPHFGKQPIDRVTEADVRKALIEIWLTKPETAKRVRQRIGGVIDWAKANGFRNLSLDLRTRSLAMPRQKVTDNHHAAMPYREVAAFLAAVRELEAASDSVRLLLEFIVLTAVRIGEARLAVWDEVDLAAKTWTIPAARMKAGVEHRVPLSDRAAEILEIMAARRLNRTDLIFPGMKAGRPLSDMALAALYRRLEIETTTHGFRSSFRDWAAEKSSFSREAAEAALAHKLGSKVETAYLRSDYFQERRKLMQAWADFLNINKELKKL